GLPRAAPTRGRLLLRLPARPGRCDAGRAGPARGGRPRRSAADPPVTPGGPLSLTRPVGPGRAAGPVRPVGRARPVRPGPPAGGAATPPAARGGPLALPRPVGPGRAAGPGGPVGRARPVGPVTQAVPPARSGGRVPTALRRTAPPPPSPAIALASRHRAPPWRRGRAVPFPRSRPPASRKGGTARLHRRVIAGCGRLIAGPGRPPLPGPRPGRTTSRAGSPVG